MTAIAPPERATTPWWRLLLAAIAFVVLADLPLLRTLLPIHEPLVLVAPALAACAVVGWWRGGSPALALVWTAFAAWRLWVPLQGGSTVAVLASGWSAMLAACFGIVLLAARSRWFLTIGLSAVALALLVSTTLVISSRSGPASLTAVVQEATAQRGARDLEVWQVARNRFERDRATTMDENGRAILDSVEASVAGMAGTARLTFPSLLAVQSLAALALAWALFHRISRARVGEPLRAIREFRFNDQFVWAVIAGLVLALLPALASFRALGINLLVFFGFLYVLRGTGVVAWFLRPGRNVLGLLVGVALVVLLGQGAAIALGLVGIGDTWADWRQRLRPAAS